MVNPSTTTTLVGELDPVRYAPAQRCTPESLTRHDRPSGVGMKRTKRRVEMAWVFWSFYKWGIRLEMVTGWHRRG
jgi:hypothetical protein